jgi:hypothetical protein
VRIPRTEQLLGCRLDELSVAVIDRLVAERAAEDESLDFKRSRYEDNAKGLYEVAKDVAALANAGGGLIILGGRGSSDPVPATSVAELISYRIKARIRRAARRPKSRLAEIRPGRKRPGREATEHRLKIARRAGHSASERPTRQPRSCPAGARRLSREY